MAHQENLDILDLVLAPASIAILIAYHVFLCYKVRSCPMQTVMGINHKARRLWVYEMLIENHKKNVLAVQTLRNSIMEATLMATTAVLLTAALATYLTFANTIKQLSPVRNQVHGISGSVCGTVKAVTLIASLMASFLCHTQSIRYINYVNYMINVPILPDGGSGALTPEYIASLLERSTIFYTMGARSFYASFPLLFWIFGSVPMFITTLVLVHVLYNSDFVDPPPSRLIMKELEVHV